jgi:hypothetical protein
MRNKIAPNWFPFWIDKWLFGSTRIELSPPERGIFIDLMALAQKDEGYIRANVGVPYRLEQLAGFLCLDKRLLERTIERCIEVGKFERLDDGTLRLVSFEKYIASERHRRRINAAMMADKADTMAAKPAPSDTIRNDTIRNDTKDIKADNTGRLFEEFWTAYPREGRFHKKACGQRFAELVKGGYLDELKAGFAGYLGFLKHKELNENFKQQPLHVMTFLNKERYMTYKDFKYEPRL